MKVLLLGFGKIAYMPYMNFYLDSLADYDDAQIELIYWDRDGKPDAEIPSIINKAYKFEAHLEEQLPFKKKLKFFLKYRRFALSVLRNNKYDKVIVLHTTPGLTLIDYLYRKYKGRYILDFRDISYEYIDFYRWLVQLLVGHSYITFISSNAFRKYLPKLNKIHTIHNYSEDTIRYKLIRNNKPRNRTPVRVSYWGLVRQVEINKRMIDIIGNDQRFELHYYGRMQQDGRDMEQYAIQKEYTNVFFHGQYLPEDRARFAQETEIIHNVYNLSHTTGNAMGNKYYDGLIFCIPQICLDGSYMANEVINNGVGISINLCDDDISDQLWNYYNSIDWETFEMNCLKTFNTIEREQNEGKKLLTEWLES